MPTCRVSVLVTAVWSESEGELAIKKAKKSVTFKISWNLPLGIAASSKDIGLTRAHNNGGRVIIINYYHVLLIDS